MKKPNGPFVAACMLLWVILIATAGFALAGGTPASPAPSNTNVIQLAPPPGYTGSLYIAVHPEEGMDEPSAELLVTDPRGRRLGLDPRTETGYSEIPDAYYDYEELDELDNEQPGPVDGVLNIADPQDGEYRLLVIGTEDGKYDIEVEATDRDMNPSYGELLGVRTGQGTLHEYRLVFSGRPGAKVSIKPAR